MEEAPKDFPEVTVDHEEVVLTRWEKCQKWWSIIMACKKTIMFLLGIGAVSTAGNITGTNYWKEAAIQMGLLDRPEVQTEVPEEEVPRETSDYEKVIKLIREHTHEYKHKLSPAQQELIGREIAKQLKGLIPENHESLH